MQGSFNLFVILAFDISNTLNNIDLGESECVHEIDFISSA